MQSVASTSKSTSKVKKTKLLLITENTNWGIIVDTAVLSEAK